MKILGKAASNVYICEVDHTEIEKFLNKYYNKQKILKIGDAFDLGKGYDFHQDIKIAMQNIRSFIKSQGKTIEAILEVCRLERSNDD